MPPPLRARYVASRDGIVIPGAREFSLLFGSDENLHALLPDLADVSLTSLVRAIREFRDAIHEKYIWMYFYDQEPARFNPDVSPHLPFNLECSRERFWVRAQLNATISEVAPPLALLRALTPLLARHNARPERSETQDEFGLQKVYLSFSYSSIRGLRVCDVHQLASKVSSLASAISSSGRLEADAIEALVHSGDSDLLVGQYEHEWFDAKSTSYQMSNPDDRFELAKDVAAFANSRNGGLIVCGLRTAKRRGSDVVREAAPISLERFSDRAWIRAIRKLVVPAPEGLAVRARRISGPGSARGYVTISVPPQPEHLRPFLVQLGCRQDGRIVDTDITVPIRIGENTEYSDAAALHGLLTAGRAVLQRHAENDETILSG